MFSLSMMTYGTVSTKILNFWCIYRK